MCCLKYEHPLYQDFRATAPKLGESVETPDGPGTVVGHNVPGDKVVVKLDRGERVSTLEIDIEMPDGEARRAWNRVRARVLTSTDV